MADLKTTNIFGDAYINNKVGIATNAPATRLQIGQLSPTAATEGLQFGDDINTRIYRSAAGIVTISGSLSAVGNVGIGTTSPIAKLETYGGSMDPTLTPGDPSIFSVNSLGVQLAVGRMVTSPFSVWLQGKHATVGGGLTYPMVLNPLGGNVGIGTAGPSGVLDIQSSNTGDQLVRTWNTNTAGTGKSLLRIANSGNNAQGTQLQFTDFNYFVGTIATDRTNGMAFYVGQQATALVSERMRIDINGNVGIGTTVPSSKLEVGNFLDEVTNKIIVSARYDYQPEFNFRLGQSGTNYDWIGGVISCGDDGNYNGVMNFKTCNSGRGTPTTKMVIKASGNVGIGTTVPSTTLHVNGIISGSSFSGAGTGLTGTAANLTAGAATTATNSTQLDGVAAASYVTLNGTQTLTNKTITGTITTASYANALNAANNYSVNSLTEGGYLAYPLREYVINLSSQSTSNFYPIAIDSPPGTDGTWHHSFSIDEVNQSGAAAYNIHSMYGEVRGQGWTDQPYFHRIFHNFYDSAERSLLGIWRPTQNWYGVVIYVRGGKNYYVRTTSRSAVGYSSAWTIGSSVFAIKNVAGADVSGTSANIAEMLNFVNNPSGFYHSDNAYIGTNQVVHLGTTSAPNLSVGGSAGSAATSTTASYANALNAANQYTVGGITGSLFGTSSWATNATTANNVGNGTITISAGTGMSIGSPNTFTTNQSGNTSVVVTNSAPNETHTGEVTGATALTIAANAVTTTKIADANVTLAKIANISTGTILGNNGASAAAPLALTSAQVATMLSGQTMNIVGTATTASYANALNAANQYTVSGITGSLFGTSSWATNAVSANNVNNATLTIGAGTGISLSATPTFTANASADKTITVTNSSPNATHTGDVTGATTLTIAANAVTTTKIADANVTNVKLSNSSVTIGSTAVSLGATATTIAGLSSVTSTNFVGALTGTATTASYANALNTANQYTVSGITGSLFGTSSWATNAVTALNGGVTSISAGIGIGTSASTGAVTITNSSPNATHTGDVTGATTLTIANDAVTTVKILNANVTNAKLANSSVTIGSTAVSLGATATTIAGLTSVTSTTFVGALTGTATTASYANALNSANQYTVGGITGSLFGTSSWATTATNSTQLGGVAAASYVTLTGTQTLTNKTVSGSFTGVMIENRAVQTSISGALTIDVSTANVHVISLTSGANVTSITYNNRTAEPAVNTILLVLKYAGSATVSWTSVVWANGTAPTLTGVNGYADVYALTSYKGTTGSWIGTVVAQNLVSTNL